MIMQQNRFGLTGKQVLANSMVMVGLLLAPEKAVQAQDSPPGRLWAVANDWVRIVFPSEEALDSTMAHRLIEAFERQLSIPGLPPSMLKEHRITISLAAEATPGIDGRAFPASRLIVIPFENAHNWDQAKLNRVIRHELAHIGLTMFLEYERLPIWFEEGFAGWTAGEMTTCLAKLRIGIDLQIRRREERSPPNVVMLGRARLFYDYSATFFQYLDEAEDGVVTKGVLLQSVRDHGIDRGIAVATGATLKELEAMWWSYLSDRYEDALGDLTDCKAV